MKLEKSHWVGIISAAVILAISGLLLIIKVSFFDMTTFYFVLGIAVVVAGLPFFTNLLLEARREKSVDSMFLEFSRDLVEGVKAGTPISKSIINLKGKDYGSLNPYIEKLANQISLGIPVKDALETFSKDVKSPVISRAVSLIKEAEIAGGKIESILESVAFSVAQIEKLKKERKAAVYSLTVQGYIIFMIFILIMLVMEFKIIPILSNLGSIGLSGNLGQIGASGMDATNNAAAGLSPSDFAKPFLILLLTQGFFAGLIVGKISEGTVKGGLKHSFILVALAWLLSTGADLIFLK
jgi:flagellar protein FlaJ